MVFSKSTNMSMRALILMTKCHPKQYFSVPELAASMQCSKTYLNKIMQSLVKAGILLSRTGPGMGFCFSKPPEEIKLIDIIRVSNDVNNFERCFFGWDECADKNPCPLHDYYGGFRENIVKKIHEINLKEASETSWPLSTCPGNAGKKTAKKAVAK